jgi:hypothetical protein
MALYSKSFAGGALQPRAAGHSVKQTGRGVANTVARRRLAVRQAPEFKSQLGTPEEALYTERKP